MKKNFKKYLAILLAVVTVLSTFALASCNPNGFGKDTDTEPAKTTPSLSIETKNSPFMSLSAKTVTRATTNGNVLEHILTATVLPESAENKDVYWAVKWEDPSRTEIVSSYVMLTTNETGGNVATITCVKPFTGNIVITVTTMEGGFTASCICKYVGLPSEIDVDLSDLSMVTDTDWNTDIAEVGQTTTYHEIALSNIFGAPGADFTPEYDIVLEAHGGIKTKNTTHDASGNLTGTEQGELTLQTMDFFDTAGYYSAYFAGTAIANQIFVGIRDGQLYISGQSYPTAYNTEKKNVDGTVSKAVFDGYIDDMEPYVTVTLTEKVTGITYTFNVRTVGTVSDVNLDYSEIIF
jgi:predicted small secreted protein